MAPHSVLDLHVALGDRCLGNFSAGPACLPDSVMRQAQAEFCNMDDTGMSIMEMSHRDIGGPVQSTLWCATQNLRTLLDVPENYHIIFMQGGAHGQVSLTLSGN